MKMKKYIFTTLILLSSCMTPKDPSIAAIDALDFTVMNSACEAMPGRGADICRVKEKTQIASSWKLILPKSPKLKGGEVAVYYKDTSKTYPINDVIVDVPWKDIIGRDIWDTSDYGVAQAIATIRYEDNDGIEKIIRAKGLALLIVMREGYDPAPIDSGFEAFSTDCKISYTTAGRSAIKCK